MFSGIIKEIGTIKNIKSHGGIVDLTISIDNGQWTNNKISAKNEYCIQLGDSIAVDGCCLTVTDFSPQIQEVAFKSNDISQMSKFFFTVQVTQESLDKTNFKKLEIGSRVNLEPALKMGDSLDGHLVSGHVDSIGEVLEVNKDGENTIFKIKYPDQLSKYIAQKGSICVNGVSLTVIDSKNSMFSFTLIPFTRDNTNLGLIKPGDQVNLEIDLVSRYLVNYMENTKKEVVV